MSVLGKAEFPDSSATRQTALDFDIKRLTPLFLDDPFPVYRALREHDPVHRMPDGSYFLSRYDDCATVYRDPGTWSSDKTIDFRPNLGKARSTSTTPPAWSSTIRRTTAVSASFWRPLSLRAR